MNWDYAERRRRVRNYRFMFRSALAVLGLGMLTLVLGIVVALSTRDTFFLVFGILLVVWSAGSAWLTVDSTVRIIELDMEDGRGVRG